jgi:hypothetical protein
LMIMRALTFLGGPVRGGPSREPSGMKPFTQVLERNGWFRQKLC